MKITFSSSPSSKSDAVVVGIYADLKYTKAATALDNELGGAIKDAIAANYFKGKDGQSLTLNGQKNAPAKRVLVIGLGKEGEGTENGFYVIGAKIAALLRTTPDKSAEIRLDGVKGKGVSAEEAAAYVAAGAYLRSWRFDKYHTKLEDHQKPKLASITVVTDKKDEAAKAFEPLQAAAEGNFFTRDLVSEPANILYPEELAKRASELKKLGVEVEILGEKKMKELGMGALLGVGQGSARESQLVVLQWNGGKKSDKPLAFVGKGVTFDTGGISLKPSAGMEDMKGDMGGAGAVVGLLKTLALRKAKVNVVGVIGCVENMPGGNAQRPGDVVKTMSGQTIEVLNTDAEGRLVLSDALWYTQDRFKPQFMVNLATLTGAIVIALGHEYAGLFSNNDELSKRLTDAGEKVNEKLWRFPLHKNYDKDIDSDVADVANQQKTPRAAGSITAAHFLQRFVNDYPWAHLDIAGVEAVHKDLPLSEKGATGFGVRLLDRLVKDYYEN